MLDLRKLSAKWKQGHENASEDGEASTEGLQTLTFRIEGMSCSCEGQIVEKRVKALGGVRSFSLNPITYQMKLACDPSSVTVEAVEKAVAKAGVRAVFLPGK